jgi:hypothetical protein
LSARSFAIFCSRSIEPNPDPNRDGQASIARESDGVTMPQPQPMASANAKDIRTFVNLSAALSVQSLDLRAQYEAKLRILTRIQRGIESLRRPDATLPDRRTTVDKLNRAFADLIEANRSASETLGMIRDEFDRVHELTTAVTGKSGMRIRRVVKTAATAERLARTRSRTVRRK